MSPVHLSVIGGVFLLESVVWYTALVCYSEFRCCQLFGSSKCIASTGIAVGTFTVVCYSEEVRYWKGLLSEVQLYSPISHKVCLDRTCKKNYDALFRFSTYSHILYVQNVSQSCTS